MGVEGRAAGDHVGDPVAGHALGRHEHAAGDRQAVLTLEDTRLADRERRATQRRLVAAKFPHLKSLDEVDFAAQPSVNRPLVLELARGESVILLGGPGTGKTHVAVGLAVAACRGRTARFYRVTELLTQLCWRPARSVSRVACGRRWRG